MPSNNPVKFADTLIPVHETYKLTTEGMTTISCRSTHCVKSPWCITRKMTFYVKFLPKGQG